MAIVTTSENGQTTVTEGNLQLIQTIIDGRKFNDCSVIYSDYSEMVSTADPRFKSLFIALHNSKL
jgi:hypothetical protein